MALNFNFPYNLVISEYLHGTQTWKVIEKLKVLSEKRNDFWKWKVKSESEKKIEKLKVKSRNFIYIIFLSLFPTFSWPHCTNNSKISFRVLSLVYIMIVTVDSTIKYYHNSLTLTRVTVHIGLHYLCESTTYFYNFHCGCSH